MSKPQRGSFWQPPVRPSDPPSVLGDPSQASISHAADVPSPGSLVLLHRRGSLLSSASLMVTDSVALDILSGLALAFPVRPGTLVASGLRLPLPGGRGSWLLSASRSCFRGSLGSADV